MPLTALMRNLSIGASADIARSRLYLDRALRRHGHRRRAGALGLRGYSDGADLDGANTAIPELLRIKPEINSFARFRGQDGGLQLHGGGWYNPAPPFWHPLYPQSHMSRCSRYDIRGKYVVDFGQRRIEAAPNYTASNLPNWSVARVPDNSMVGAPGLEPATR